MSIKTVRIAGRSLRVRASEDESHLDRVVEELNQRIRDVQKRIPDSSESMLFVSLALMDELVSARQQLEEIRGGAQGTIQNLLSALETFESRPTHTR